MSKVFPLLLVSIGASLLIGCTAPSNEGLVVQEKPVIEQVLNETETIYEVRTVDWLFGNWMEICNDDVGCKQVNLHETGLRSTIKEDVLIKVTETLIQKGSRNWTETEYTYVED